MLKSAVFKVKFWCYQVVLAHSQSIRPRMNAKSKKHHNEKRGPLRSPAVVTAPPPVICDPRGPLRVCYDPRADIRKPLSRGRAVKLLSVVNYR